MCEKCDELAEKIKLCLRLLWQSLDSRHALTTERPGRKMSMHRPLSIAAGLTSRIVYADARPGTAPLVRNGVTSADACPFVPLSIGRLASA